MKSVLIIKVIVVLVTLGVTLYLGISERSSTYEELVSQYNLTPLQSGSQIFEDLTNGEIHGANQMMIFYNYNCGYCADFYRNAYDTLLTEKIDVGKLDVVWIPVVDAKDSLGQMKACLTQIADSLGMGENIRKAFFSTSPESSTEIIETAITAGIDRQLIIKSLEERGNLEKVQQDTYRALQIGVPGTPSFVINGHLRKGNWTAGSIEKFMKVSPIVN